MDPITIMQAGHEACGLISTHPDILVGWIRLLVGFTTPEQFLEMVKATMPDDLGAATHAVQACIGAPA